MSEVQTATCQNPSCDNTYKHRSNKKFCSDNCRKEGNRPKQNSMSSPTKARNQLEMFDRALVLGEMLYQKERSLNFYKFGRLQDSPRSSNKGRSPIERLAFMEELIQLARGGDAQLRDILTKPHMRDANGYLDPHLFPFGNPAYCTIAKAASIYCYRFWKATAHDVVYNKMPEPPTGEVFKDGTVDDWPENRLTHYIENLSNKPTNSTKDIDDLYMINNNYSNNLSCPLKNAYS